MSGLEAIGAIASVSQLGQYSIKLILRLHDLARNIDRAAKRFQSYKVHVDQVRQVVVMIKNSTDIQDDILLPHVEALLSITTDIDHTIAHNFAVNEPKKWKKYLKGLQIAKAEEAILRGFDDLERNKSSLTLCILEKYWGLIFRIDATLGSGFPGLREQVDNIEKSLRACPVMTDDGQTIITLPASRTAKAPHTDRGSREDDARSSESGKHPLFGSRAITDRSATPHTTLHANMGVRRCGSPPESQCHISGHNSDRANGCHTEEAQLNQTGEYCRGNEGTLAAERPRLYLKNTACDSAVQLNGNFGAQSAYRSSYGYSEWTNNSALGSSNQINGDILDTSAASSFFFSRRRRLAENVHT